MEQLPPTGSRNHRPDGIQADHARTFKMDQSNGADKAGVGLFDPVPRVQDSAPRDRPRGLTQTREGEIMPQASVRQQRLRKHFELLRSLFSWRIGTSLHGGVLGRCSANTHSMGNADH